MAIIAATSTFISFSWVLFLFSVILPSASMTTDGLSLLALKAAVSVDPDGVLNSWIDSDGDPCGWRGVSCRDGRVTSVSLANFSLEGYLPSELSLLSSLESILLPYNRFFGQIPSAIGEIRSLVSLDLSNNDFSGPVPFEIGELGSLVTLDLSSNRLNGSLPPEIATLPRLSGVLNLSCNLFSGRIPPVYGDIPVSVSLDLRQNQLSGEIPQVGSLLNQGPTAFAGNPSLCGFPLKYACDGPSEDSTFPVGNPSFNLRSPAPRATAGNSQHRTAMMILILTVIIIVALGSFFVLNWQFRRCRSVASGDVGEGKQVGKENLFHACNDRREAQSPDEIYMALDESFDLELEELLRASAYVVGKSRSGIVYKVIVSRGPAVAVRRLSEIEDGEDPIDEWRRRRAFEAEATAIGRARHANLVRLQAFYYAPDEKLLIYDFIPNGNLFTALHGGKTASAPPSWLPWEARVSILLGAARGLAYLHECNPRKLVHGNVKSSKILLDNDFRPFLSGFGIAQLQRSVGAVSKKSPSATSGTQKDDVYAFGLVMMEVVTGRRADAGLADWVRRVFKEALPLSELVDPTLLKDVHVKCEVLAVFHTALGCTEAEPEARPKIRAVVDCLERLGTSR